MKKRILFMVLFMDCGGVEKALLNLLSLIDKDRYDVTMLLTQRSGDYLQFIPEWVKVKEVKIPKDELDDILKGKKYSIIKCIRQGQIYQAVKKIIRAIKIRTLPSGCARQAAYFEAVSSKFPVINEHYDVAIDFHGYTSFTTFYVAEKVNASIKATWIHYELKLSNPLPFRKYYEKYNYIFGVSQKCADDFIEFFPELKDRTSVFYNIISADLIKSLSVKGKGFDDDFDGIRILTVGRLSYQKGYDVAIPVFAHLKNDGYNVRWYVIGEGEERNNIEKLIKQYSIEDNFILLGQIFNPYPYLAQCDLYVQPSRSEGYCTTTNEARVFCKPVITTDVSGAREQFINGENGLIVNFDEDEIYRAIKLLINDKELRYKFSLNLSNHTIDTSFEIQKLYDLFCNI